MNIYWIWPYMLKYKNKCRYKRIFHISKVYDVTLSVMKQAEISSEIQNNVKKMFRSPRGYHNLYLNYFSFHLFCLLKFFKMNHECKFNIIYSSPNPSLLVGFIIKHLLRKKIIWVVDMWDDPRLSIYPKGPSIKRFLSFFYNFLLKTILRYADLVITIGVTHKEGLPKVLTDEFKVNSEKILCTTNGVDLDMFKLISTEQDRSDFRILYIGYIIEHHGMETLLIAVSKLVNLIPNIQLILAGWLLEKAKSNWLQRRMKALNLIDNVKFLGVVDSEHIPRLIESCDICVCPFPNKKILNFAYPIKIYEYLAMNKAVVATSLEGVRKIIKDGENGLLVEPNNPDNMAKLIYKLYKDPEFRHKIEKNARKSIQKYDWKIINNEIIKKLGEITETIQRW